MNYDPYQGQPPYQGQSPYPQQASPYQSPHPQQPPHQPPPQPPHQPPSHYPQQPQQPPQQQEPQGWRSRENANTIIRIVRAVTGVAAAVFLLHILFVVFDANQGNAFVSLVYGLAKVLVLGLGDVFTPDDATIGVILNYSFAALVYLIIGRLVARALRRP